MNITENKFSNSDIIGIKCIGPCYDKMSKNIINPLNLVRYKNSTVNLCPTFPFIYNDTIENFAPCGEPTKTKQDIFSMVLPTIGISSEYFIYIYYNIKNLEDLLNWLDNNTNLPYRTKERVFNNGMVEYGNDIKIIDHRFVDHISYLLHYNLHKIYIPIREYIKVNKNNIELLNPIYIDKKDRYVDNKNTIQLIRHYIKDKFLNHEFIYKYVIKFVKYYKTNLTDKYITDILVTNMIDYIIKCINLSFD